MATTNGLSADDLRCEDLSREFGAFAAPGGGTPLILSTMTGPTPILTAPDQQPIERDREEVGAEKVGLPTCPPWLLILAIVVAFFLFRRG